MNTPNSSLSQFIEEYPLYSKFGTHQPIEAADLDNLAFNYFCTEEKEIQPFRLTTNSHNGFPPASPGNGPGNGHSPGAGQGGFTELFTGICQSCEKYKVNIVINGASQNERPTYFIRKIGQYPAPQSSLSKLSPELAGFLSQQSREFYGKALSNLEQECGTAALAYFKRVIKTEIERIVETIANPYSTDGDRIVEAFTSYQRDQQKTKFIEEVTPHLPPTLKDHGAHVLLVLHDALMIDIHDLTEKECMKKSIDIDLLFRYVARKICLEIDGFPHQKAPNKYFLRYS